MKQNDVPQWTQQKARKKIVKRLETKYVVLGVAKAFPTKYVAALGNTLKRLGGISLGGYFRGQKRFQSNVMALGDAFGWSWESLGVSSGKP